MMNLIDQRYVDAVTGSMRFQSLVLRLELETLMDEILATLPWWARWLFEKRLAADKWISRKQRTIEVWKIKRRWRKQMRIS